MIHVLVPDRKKKIFDEYLGHWGMPVADRIRLHRYEELPGQRTLPRGQWVFTDLDGLNPEMLGLVESLRDAMVEHDVAIMNDTRRALRRRALLNTLHVHGINAFRAVGVDADLDSLRFPVFVRRASSHAGPLSPLLQTRRELDRWIAQAWLWGTPTDDVLVIEFLDTADAAGLYWKYAAFVVGDRIIPRSLNRGSEWIVKHGTTDFTADFQREELAYVENNPHGEALAEVMGLAGIDYGRVDYSVLNGRIQVWEINMCPTIGRGARRGVTSMPAEVQELRQRAKQCFYSSFADAWIDADVADSGTTFPTLFSDRARQAALESLNRPRRPQRLKLLRTLLRPAKPLIQPIVNRTLATFLMARRSRSSGRD